MNYGGIDADNTAWQAARFVVIPVPYDLTSTYQAGSRRGPAAIIEASANMELYDEELKQETYRAGIHTMTALEIDASGPAGMIEPVHRAVAGVLAADKIPVLLGGEHSISFGAVRAMKEKYPTLSVLQLDAHADLRDRYQGSPYSHAAVARRIAEICPLVQAGIRSLSAEEANFLNEGKVKTFFAHDLLGKAGWQEEVCRHLSGDVYITMDLDVLDPAIMPATGTPEPGGLVWGDLLCLLRLLCSRCHVRGFDVVELTPIPGMVAPEFMAAKLIYRLLGYLTLAQEKC